MPAGDYSLDIRDLVVRYGRHTVLNGVSLVNFDGFAPASQWEELSVGLRPPVPPKACGVGREVGKKRVPR